MNMRPSQYGSSAAADPPISTHIIITVHGIWTFGRWQERLERLVCDIIPEARFVHYKIGFVFLLSYLIPIFRWRELRRFRRELQRHLPLHGGDRIDIVAHSFGTYLVAWGLAGMTEAQRPRIHTLILAGSVLHEKFYWTDLFASGSVRRVVNECGLKDWVLCLNRIVVPMSGAAGFVGFTGLTSQFMLKNYWHHCSHSGFFTDEFMREYWTPILVSTDPPSRPDLMLEGRIQKLLVLLLQIWSPFKLGLYVLVIAAIFWFGYEQPKRTARMERLNEAKELTSESETTLVTDPTLSLWLATYAAQMTWSSDGVILPETHNAYYNALGTGLPFILASHVGEILGAHWSPDGHLAATFHPDRIEIWDGGTGKELLTHFISNRSLTSVAWNPDGHNMAISTMSGVGIWDLSSDRETSELESPAVAVRWSPDGRFISAILDDLSLAVWNATTRSAPYTIRCPKAKGIEADWGAKDGEMDVFCREDRQLEWFVWDFQAGKSRRIFSTRTDEGTYGFHDPHRAHVVMVKKDRTLVVLDIKTSKEVLRVPGHVGNVDIGDWSPDGERLAVPEQYYSVGVWDISTGRRLVRLVGNQSAVTRITWAEDGTELTTGSIDGTARIWQVDTGKEVAKLKVGRLVDVLEWNRDRKQILVDSLTESSAIIWNTSEEPTAIKLSDLVTQVEWGPDGRQIFGVATDYNAVVYDSSSGREVFSVSRKIAPDLGGIWSRSWTRFLSYDKAKNITLWSVKGQSFTRSWTVHSCDLTRLAFSTDERKIALGCRDGAINILESKHGRLTSTLNSHQDKMVFSLSWNPSDQLLSVSTFMGRLEIWDVRAGRVLYQISEHSHLIVQTAWSPNGQMLATAAMDEDRVWIWNPNTGTTVTNFWANDGSISSVEFSHDGAMLAVGSFHLTTIWSVSSRRSFRIPGEFAVKTNVAWSPTSEWIAIGRSEQFVRFRPIAGDAMLSNTKRVTSRTLTDAECRQYIRGLPCGSKH